MHADQNMVDVVLLDLNLPDGQGIETIKSVSHTLMDTPIVILSSDSDSQTRQQAYQLGVEAFLDKSESNVFALEATIRCAMHAVACRKRMISSEQEIEILYTQIQAMMIEILSLNHPNTAEHSRRVADVAATIATKMGISDARVAAIRTAGILHDLDKLSSSTKDILENTGLLTSEHWTITRKHPEVTLNLLSKMN